MTLTVGSLFSGIGGLDLGLERAGMTVKWCPAFSQAARGRNVAADLWPWMRDAIAYVRPEYVLIENVAAHLGRGFSAVLDDLDVLGFDAEWSVVTACSVGASHTRRRLFALAYTDRDREPVFPEHGEVAGLRAPTRDCRDGWLPATDDARADDGIPHRLDRDRALGNAVVPQVAELIGRQLLASLSLEEKA